MRANYRAWRINVKEFYVLKTDQDRLKFLIRFGVLAPSSHNSQPWKFGVADDEIRVRTQMRRALAASDPNNRQLFISLGCAIENILVAADYYGFATALNYKDGGADISFKRTRLETVRDQNHLIFAIPRRHTNRNAYGQRQPDERFVEYMKSLATEDIRIECITDRRLKNETADVVLAAGITAMEDKVFRRELSQYVKSNLTSSKMGMPAFGMGIPTPVSLAAPFMIKFFNMNKIMCKHDEKLLKEHTPAFVIISTREDTPEAWMRAGRKYERIALEAEGQNINTAPLAAAIQIGEHYKELQRLLGASFRPQVFFRLGYAAKITPHSPRLLAAEVTEE